MTTLTRKVSTSAKDRKRICVLFIENFIQIFLTCKPRNFIPKILTENEVKVNNDLEKSCKLLKLYEKNDPFQENLPTPNGPGSIDWLEVIKCNHVDCRKLLLVFVGEESIRISKEGWIFISIAEACW